MADGIFCSVLRCELAIFCPIRIKENDPKPTCIDGVNHDVMKLLCNSKRKDHTSIELMLEKLDWLSLNQLACEIRLIEVWKALNKDDHCLSNLFEKAATNEGITRSADKNRLKNHFK